MGALPSRANHGSVRSTDRTAKSLFILVAFLFVLSTLFDPADKILGLKLPLYLLCWCMGLVVCLGRQERIRIPIVLLVYTLLMIAIPLLSIAYYFLVDGSEPFEGFQLLKAYLFISMALLLYVTRTNLLKYLCIALTVLAVSILVVATVVLLQPALFLPIYLLGDQYGVFSTGYRDYGSGLVLFQMYFVTSPMLAISAAYYFNLAKVSKERRSVYGTLAALNLGAMVLAGTRNNMMAAVVLPLALIVLHSKRKWLVVGLIGTVTGVGVFLLSDQIGILLNPAEASNRTKLGLLGDYSVLFGKVTNLLLGRGLGAYEHWTGRGYYFITELTYLEIVRNFGLLLGGVMILLLLYPVIYAFVLRRSYNEQSIVVGYMAYLVMCISNPLFFSSMGMLVLGVIIANISLYETTVRRTRVLESDRHARSQPHRRRPSDGS